MQDEIAFEKYRLRGAYHWQNYFGSLFKVDCFLRARYDVVISFLKKSGITKFCSVLEVGCGDGALSGLIYKTFHCNLSGLDPSTEGIRYAREMFEKFNFKGTFEISEGYTFNFPDNHFEFVILADVVEHLQYPERMLQEMKRVLKPGGKAIITTPVRTREHPEDKMHVHEYFPGELVAFCEKEFSKPLDILHSHPAAWHEWYSYGKKWNRSMMRLYCRICDKLLGRNAFLQNNHNSHWQNFKQQGIILQKPA